MQDLENHTLTFAQAVRTFVRALPMTVANVEDIKELVRHSGAVGATYIGANGSANKRDFLIGLKKCANDAKVSQYYLRLIDTQGVADLDNQRHKLIAAAEELSKVFSTLMQKVH